jgi:hypothetical protein
MSIALNEDKQFKLNIPYRPYPLKHHQLPPEGYDYGVEIYIPNKEMAVKGLETYEQAKAYLGKVRELQATGVVLYARILRRNLHFSVYPSTSRIRPVDPVKGKLYCPECNDYTEYSKKYGYEGSDLRHCQYCGLSDNDFNVKSLNGLWEGRK